MPRFSRDNDSLLNSQKECAMHYGRITLSSWCGIKQLLIILGNACMVLFPNFIVRLI